MSVYPGPGVAGRPLKGVVKSETCAQCVFQNFINALSRYEAEIRQGAVQLGVENMAEAGESSTVMAALNRILLDAKAKLIKIGPNIGCCAGLTQKNPRHRCPDFKLPPVER